MYCIETKKQQQQKVKYDFHYFHKFCHLKFWLYKKTSPQENYVDYKEKTTLLYQNNKIINF